MPKKFNKNKPTKENLQPGILAVIKTENLSKFECGTPYLQFWKGDYLAEDFLNDPEMVYLSSALKISVRQILAQVLDVVTIPGYCHPGVIQPDYDFHLTKIIFSLNDRPTIVWVFADNLYPLIRGKNENKV